MYDTLETAQEIYTVTELVGEAHDIVESNFPSVWLQAEISNLARPGSGHWYFSLKDRKSQLRCAMFKGNNRCLDFTPDNGMEVMVRGRLSIYTARGDFQMIVDHMEPEGEGELKRKFEKLKRKLEQEGLFDVAHKQELPYLPQSIGVVTSSTGAALHDVLSVLGRRFPAIPIIIYPTLVQGNKAAKTITQAINLANEREECDVIILCRGGGSLEDLWPFNEEPVARAIFASTIPIVSGVGHEVDFTIADFVADERAPTPSAAAELVTPDAREILENILGTRAQLTNLITQRIERAQERIQWLSKRLPHPQRVLQQQAQRLDYIALQLQSALQRQLQQKAQCLTQLSQALSKQNPQLRLQLAKQQLERLQQKLTHQLNSTLQLKTFKLKEISRALNTVSPLATLERGYAIVQNNQQQVIVDGTQLKPGDKVRISLSKHSVAATIDNID